MVVAESDSAMCAEIREFKESNIETLTLDSQPDTVRGNMHYPRLMGLTY